MKFDKIAKLVDGIPFTSMSKGKIFYDFVIKNKPQNCLELGFGFGVGSSYIAGALDENKSGQLTIVDLEKSFKSDKFPNVTAEKLIDDLKLNSYVSIVREKKSYIWFLKRMIDENTFNKFQCNKVYDFVFIDGPKHWITDGFAFFLVDKLLKEGGWIVFDDYLWKMSDHQRKIKPGSGYLDDIDEGHLDIPQIKEVFEKLLMQTGKYSNFNIDDNILAWAQKVKADNVKIAYTSSSSLKYKFLTIIKKLLKRNY